MRQDNKFGLAPRALLIAAIRVLCRRDVTDGNPQNPPDAEHAVQVSGAPSRATANPADAGHASPVPESSTSIETADSSGTFRSELAAIMAQYAEQIAAVEAFYPPSIARGVIKRLTDERTVAVKSLMERWKAAQQNKKPLRPESLTRGGIEPPIPRPAPN